MCAGELYPWVLAAPATLAHEDIVDTGDDTSGRGGDEAESRTPWHRAWATVALVAVNASVFLAMVFAGASPLFTSPADAMAAGGVDPRRVWDGEVWRLLTACFVHLGFWHLALNMWVLWQLGRALERLVGSARLLLIYLTSGIFGFALSLATTAKPTAGASGAVFGVTGGLLALALLMRHKELGKLILDALLPFVVATLVLGFLVPMVDNSAHVGGLVFGFLVCFGLSAGDRDFFVAGHAAGTASRWERALGTSSIVLAALLFLGVGSYAARPFLSPLYLARTGLLALQSGDLAHAQESARAAARIAPADGATLVLLGRLHEERAAAPADREEAVRLAADALRRFDEDVPSAFRDAQIALLLIGGGTDDLPFHDQRTVNLLCDAALRLLPEPPSPADDNAFARAEVRNECAWLKVKSGDARVFDPAAGLVQARAAVIESRHEVANHVHTLAEALAQNGDAAEALALLEKLAAEGRAAELPGGAAFLEAERRRMRQLVDAPTARAAPESAVVGAPGGTAPDASTPGGAVPAAPSQADENATSPGVPR